VKRGGHFRRNGVAITREIRSPTRTKSLLQGAALVVAPRRDTMRGSSWATGEPAVFLVLTGHPSRPRILR
jgi:hypothetical protein